MNSHKYYSRKLNSSPPIKPVKIVFVHHSCGNNLLSDSNGSLGKILEKNNYYVSDTNYGWGIEKIGSQTDIGQLWNWFRGSNSIKIMKALYMETRQHGNGESFSRMNKSIAGENVIIMFKSCFPNSMLKGLRDDQVPTIKNNPLKGQPCSSDFHTIANAKGIYLDILKYFASRKDKMFVLLTAPPVLDKGFSENARSFNNWLVFDWLSDYPYSNVFVFDMFNVLTSNMGSININDLNSEDGNHHRIVRGRIEHQFTSKTGNTLAYPGPDGNMHPNHAGNLKCSFELVDVLNAYYNLFINSADPPKLINKFFAS